MHRILFLLSMSEDECQEDSCDDCHQVVRMGAEGCLGLHGVRLIGVGCSWRLSRGLRPRAPTSFFLLIEENEAKEDQGDDCHQVVRMGAEGCLDLHGVRLVGAGDSLGLSRGLRPRTLTSFSSLDRRKGSKRRSRR